MKQMKTYLETSDQKFKPSVREENVKVVCDTKYLSVQIDEYFTWKIQIKSVTGKASRAIGFLKYAKHFLPEAFVETLYNSIVEPRCQYCCSVWGCCNSTDILGLQRPQNRAALIVTSSHFDAPSKPLIQSLGWKTIDQLINRQINLTVFEWINGIAPKYLSNIFTKNAVDAAHSLRNTNTDFRLPLKALLSDKNAFRSEVQNVGIAFQLRPNRHLQLKPLSDTFSLSRSMYKLFNRFLPVYYILAIIRLLILL